MRAGTARAAASFDVQVHEGSVSHHRPRNGLRAGNPARCGPGPCLFPGRLCPAVWAVPAPQGCPPDPPGVRLPGPCHPAGTLRGGRCPRDVGRVQCSREARRGAGGPQHGPGGRVPAWGRLSPVPAAREPREGTETQPERWSAGLLSGTGAPAVPPPSRSLEL